MTLYGFLLMAVIAGVVGAIGQALAGFSGGGCIGSIAIGFVGAFIGTWLADALNLPTIFAINVDSTSFPVVWALVGSILFVAVLSLFIRRRPVD